MLQHKVYTKTNNYLYPFLWFSVYLLGSLCIACCNRHKNDELILLGYEHDPQHPATHQHHPTPEAPLSITDVRGHKLLGAADLGELSLLKEMLAAGVDPNLKKFDRSKISKILFPHMGNLEYVLENIFGNSALHFSCIYGSLA